MVDLETLREIFKDQRLHIAVGQIKKLALASDRSVLRCLVSIFPEEREIVTKMTWDSVGPESGFFCFPAVGDLVLVAFAEGLDDEAYVIKRLTSIEDKIPVNAAAGDAILKALSGKKVWITSGERINLSSGDSEPNENLVLGKVLQQFLSQLLQAMATSTHISGAPGYPTSPPQEAATYTTLKANPVDNGDVLSDVAFTEKG